MPEEFDGIIHPQMPEGRNPSEQALRKRAERFRLFFKEMPIGATLNEIICDERGKPIDHVYVEANPAFERLVGLRREDIVGWRMREVLPDVDPSWIEKYGEVALTRQPTHFEAYLLAVDKDFDLHVFSPRTGQFAVLFVDITRQKRAERVLRESEKKLRQLAENAEEASLASEKRYRDAFERKAEESLRQLWNRLLRVQDEERQRIGRELHDVTGQVLTTLAMKLGVVRRTLGVDEAKAREALAEALVLTKQCSDDVRTLSYLLHSPVLEEGGLEAALRPYVESFSQRSEIHIELDLPADFGRLRPEIEVALFRVVQESLTNIHLHSGSSSATIRVVRNLNEVILEIRDEGRGIPPEVLEKIRTRAVMPGVGIASMQERIQQVGGRLDVSSGEHGTLVRATVPLSAEGS